MTELPPPAEWLNAIVLRQGRGWRVTWLEAVPLRAFRAATLEAAVADATAMAADFYRGNPAAASAELALLIFGRRQPVFVGAQLIVKGEPGHLTAIDVRDDSVLHGATPRDLFVAAGANPARPGDYALRWMRPVPAILAAREGENRQS